MRFPAEKKNAWREGFAFFPTDVEGKTVWLERFLFRHETSIYGHILPGIETRFYEGCAERVGYPCDCIRHR